LVVFNPIQYAVKEAPRMTYIDVFNGDADGIFSLIQMRKAKPVKASEQKLISGVKRDNSLIKKISDGEADAAIITALDISFDKNTDDLKRVLEKADSVFYCDHHQAKSLFDHEKLTHLIDFSPNVCTGLLVSKHLGGMFHEWAITAAFGDSLDSVGFAESDKLGLHRDNAQQLRELGILVNYNGYGATVEDLHFAPEALYRALCTYGSPFEAINDTHSPFAQLQKGFAEDVEQAARAEHIQNDDVVTAVMLDNAPWARRISGTLGNDLAHQNPDKAVVIATPNADGETLTISLRAPKSNLQGAGDICSSFPTGGGRAGAAGVNALPINDLGQFVDAVADYYE